MHREVVLSRPVRAHGAEIHRLVSACGPLDLNSTYAYLLLCEHFPETCVRAEYDGRTVGFISAYRPPQQRDVLFVWQVAVAANIRGRGLARSMLHELLRRDAHGEWRYLETTVTPSNEPSRRLFHALASDLEAPVAESVLFAGHDFDGEPHESEILIRIGPINGRQPKGELIDEPEYL
jgi:L-2,4-diaminobutyric acid acetyltransferase